MDHRRSIDFTNDFIVKSTEQQQQRRLANFTIRKWNSEANIEDFDGSVPPKSSIVNLLNKFLKTRPSKEDLVANKILGNEYKPIPLRYSLIDILCSYLEKNALEAEGIFRVSGSNQQIRLFWQTFTSDNIDFPQNIHTTAGALKLYIREQNEPLVPHEFFSNFITLLGDNGVSSNSMIQLMTKVTPENLKIIKRVLRVLIIMARHSQINKMDANNMGIVFGPNIFKSRSDSPNIFSEAKYSNESVSYLISHYLEIFPDLEVPILGTETNNEDGAIQTSHGVDHSAAASSSNDNLNNNNNVALSPSSKGISVNSTTGSSTSPIMNSNSTSSPSLLNNNANYPIQGQNNPSPFSLSNNIGGSVSSTNLMGGVSSNKGSPSSSISNSSSSSKNNLVPIHPSLLDTNQMVDKVESNPLSKMKKLDFISGNLVSYGKSGNSNNSTNSSSTIANSSNLLSSSGKVKKSSTNLMNGHPSSSQLQSTGEVTLTPVYILITSQNVYSLYWDGDTHKLSFFLVPKPKVIDHIVRSFERGRAIAKLSNKSLASLQSRKFPLLEGANGSSSFSKLPESRPVFESLAQNGFTELDVWEGTVDLLEVVKKFHHILIPTEPKAVVEFLLPAIPEFKGIYRKSYKLDIKTTVYKIICLICEKAKLEPSKFLLRTLKGRTLFDNLCLGDYGLGTLFTSWQLRLIALESPESTGNFVVEFLMPNTPEFKGMQKKAIKVDAYQPLKRIMKGLCDKLKIPNHHYYHIIGPEGEVLGDNDVLSSIGLGIKYKTCKMQLAKKVFPIGRNPEIDTPMVKSLVDDIVTTSWNKIKERHNERIRIYCKQMLDYIVDQVFVEITKAELVPKRVAMLGKNSRYDFYSTLESKEEEDMILLDIQGYKEKVFQCRNIVPVELENSPNYPLYRPKLPSFKGGMGGGGITSLRDIKVNSAKNNFLNELKDNNKHQQQQQQQNGTEHTIKPSQKIKYQPPIVNNPNSIVQLLSLKPGTSKLVEQLKNRMSVTSKKINIFDVEDLVPKNYDSPQSRRKKL
ncbi:hypothetical protein DICPUDRAFT_153891 [Dictyostelium purpureum]|uniref:Rho-GAP domain-containing protein n=1 Tax=Dictyostelium purpureum TaxID=5786 RepID=F0ZQ04_DICPU|nr:uncharacterized protein DICPUDRAFT_153891 [Dictyostelium purpureum]EGC33978.1 hypothetical protein DICPUDRAFT_153891 [Dictyostelium purpureum]|eukprot:XP_003289511.1 hypothetical protein DICPUDRAFT_153891 [Dictyostelium purpureum]